MDALAKRAASQFLIEEYYNNERKLAFKNALSLSEKEEANIRIDRYKEAQLLFLEEVLSSGSKLTPKMVKETDELLKSWGVGEVEIEMTQETDEGYERYHPEYNIKHSGYEDIYKANSTRANLGSHIHGGEVGQKSLGNVTEGRSGTKRHSKKERAWQS